MDGLCIYICLPPPTQTHHLLSSVGGILVLKQSESLQNLAVKTKVINSVSEPVRTFLW